MTAPTRRQLPAEMRHRYALAANTRRLTEEDVRLIRQLWEERLRLDEELDRILRERSELTYKVLAEKFEVSPQAIADVVSGKTWKFIS